MQKIKINNKFFRSLAGASHFLNKPKQWLSGEMKDKEAITYKDLLIEKVETPENPKKKQPKHTRKGIPVLIDGVPYKNCAEAERAIGCGISSVSDALRRGAKYVCGHRVEAIYPSMIGKQHKSSKKVKVICVTTGEIYDSITEAARAAKVDDWTMSKKMEAAGSLIDANGNEYKRLTPMKTKNVYKDNCKTVRGRKLVIKRNVFKAKPIAKEEPVVIVKPEVPKVVKDAINDKIIAILKEKGIYNDIVELLKYGGFTTVKFDTNKND